MGRLRFDSFGSQIVSAVFEPRARCRRLENFKIPLEGQNDNIEQMLKYAKDLEDTVSRFVRDQNEDS